MGRWQRAKEASLILREEGSESCEYEKAQQCTAPSLEEE